MVSLAEGAVLTGTFRVLALVLVGYLVVGQPLVGRWSHRRFRRESAGDPAARTRRYRRTILLEWGLVAAALLLVVAAPGVDLPELGLRAPRWSAYTAVGTVGLAVSVVLLIGLRRRVDRGVRVVAPAEVAALLPRTARERRWFAGVALTAGVCEELLYRGLLLAVAGVELADAGPWTLVLLSAAGFGIAHLYQGAVGAVTTAVLGGCLAVLYLGSGSLLLPVLYHVLIDLRVLVLAVGQRRRPRHRAGD